MYTIYHVVGVKVGCTSVFERRKKQYSEDTVFEILEELDNCTDQFAGDREWWWADKFGYERGPHYAEKRWDIVLLPEELSYNGQLGAKAAELGLNADPEFRREFGIGFETNWYNHSEKQREDASIKSRKAVELGVTGMQTDTMCEYCGKIGQTAIMGRWHHDNCKYNPLRKTGPWLATLDPSKRMFWVRLAQLPIKKQPVRCLDQGDFPWLPNVEE
jgi:hypothetical protein